MKTHVTIFALAPDPFSKILWGIFSLLFSFSSFLLRLQQASSLLYSSMVHCLIFEQEYVTPASSMRVQANKWARQPRITSPPSFLARVPFQMVVFATVIGVCFLCSVADAAPTLRSFNQVSFCLSFIRKINILNTKHDQT